MAAPTNDVPTITLTLRELALQKQNAFTDGATTMYTRREVPWGTETARAYTEVCGKAAEHYPVPKVTRLREVGFYGTRYRYNTAEDCLEFSHFGKWLSSPRAVPYAQMVQDLTNNPTEEVDA